VAPLGLMVVVLRIHDGLSPCLGRVYIYPNDPVAYPAPLVRRACVLVSSCPRVLVSSCPRVLVSLAGMHQGAMCMGV
ncbi:MAG: hypothetical protein ABGY24_01285, partial [bacterium]